MKAKKSPRKRSKRLTGKKLGGVKTLRASNENPVES